MISSEVLVVISVVVATLVFGTNGQTAGDVCKTIDTCDTNPRQILFLLDGSNSMDIDAFNNEMLTYVQHLHCLFPNKAQARPTGLIIFNKNTHVAIPLAEYTHQEWFDAVEAMKDVGKCCSCCTPHAEAFELAHDEFTRVPNPDASKMVFVITDGVSYQNSGVSKYGSRKMPHAYYKTQVVPAAATRLKDDFDTRVVVVNVPRSDGQLTDLDFFTGRLEDREICSSNKANNAGYNSFGCTVKNNGKDCCLTVDSPPFPVVSTPLDNNIFTLPEFTQPALKTLITRTYEIICEEAWVPTCKGPVRDVLFIVDASNSMDPNRFKNEMMTLVVNVFGSLEQRLNNRAGLILFGANATVRIPLNKYSLEDWETLIDAIRVDDVASGNPDGACCSCCTPTAEAFEVARAEFARVDADGNERVSFMLTDGVPSQLRGDSKWGQDSEYSEDDYAKTIVPDQAKRLQEISRVVMLGTRNKHGDPPAANYFKNNFIVSTPVDDNVFIANTWDMKELTERVYDLLCRIVPTSGPTTPIPSESPTKFVEREVDEWDGGWARGQGDCDSSYTIKEDSVTYGPFTGCTSFDDFTPHMGSDPANLIAPDYADTTSWCPYNLANVPYNVKNTDIRKQWGYCRSYNSTRSPTVALPPTTATPTKKPTAEPTAKPTPPPALLNVAQGGGLGNGVVGTCAEAPFTIRGFAGSWNDCIPMSTYEPFTAENSAGTFPGTPVDISTDYWCPIVTSRYDKDPTQNNKSPRKNWAYCLPKSDSDTTAAPTGTAVTAAPTPDSPNISPTSGSGATAAPTVGSAPTGFSSGDGDGTSSSAKLLVERFTGLVTLLCGVAVMRV